MPRIVFMGSDPIALPALNWLAGEGRQVAEIVGVFTQPDRAAGRGQKVQPNAIKQWAEARGLPVRQPDKFADEDRTQLAKLQPDICLVMAYGHILRQAVIDTPRLGILNLHTSVLPSYRGASPIQTAIANGETMTGVSLMKLVLELDAGPVADVERVAIGPLDTATEIEAALALACVPLLARSLSGILAGTTSFTAQPTDGITFCRRLEKDDGVLDFHQPATALAGRINGLMPWPGCAVQIDGQSVKVGLADVAASPDPASTTPGTVMGADAEGLLVATGSGTLRLRRLQRPGGRMLAAADFLRGFSVPAGTHLGSTAMPPLVAGVPFPRKKG